MPADSWATLEAAGEGAGLADLRVLDTPVQVDGQSVLLGIDGEGRRHLLIPRSVAETVREDRGSRGVQIVQRDLLDGDRRRRFADVQCLAPHLNELFVTVADEMLAAIDEHSTDPVRAARRVLERWRELLRPGSGRLLGPQQLAGLFGELLILCDIVRQDPARRLDSWVGPQGARHDFVRGSRALEVKATLVREGRMVEIHGVEQLEEPEDGELSLAVVKLESSIERGLSVADLRRELLELGVSEHELTLRLAQAGYLVADEDAYRQVRFEVRERRIYPVDAEFPRIVPSSFINASAPSGVLRVSYVSDLSNEPPDPMSEARERDLLAHLAGAA